MRILAAVLCSLVMVTFICASPFVWANESIQPPPTNLADQLPTKAKGSIHLVDASGSQDGVAPQKLDVSGAATRTLVGVDSSKPLKPCRNCPQGSSDTGNTQAEGVTQNVPDTSQPARAGCKNCPKSPK
ncbi:hypothetical protein [Desulfomonile tiedjei]|uniref:Secreted protein n=1 Tax=Desulfomonile tiedjei (strain ATCC 49306 / DSM 6799 / DCB-1) TaxID=706587 RepID=I4CAU4_DESTA|nr:hypothetical protein [Desulfomonile tiedjei]AFM26685.1 hypothetical protein Desti_4046 [Desulfomonile tiedjei DSM 6799]